MFSFHKPQKGEFPELVGRNAQEAASYIASLGKLFHSNSSM